MAEGLNYYEILQVSPHASPDVIKAAHRTLSKTMHPDAGGSTALAVAINEAFDALSDPARRMRYDLELRIGAAKNFAAVPGSPRERVVEVLMVVCLGCGHKNRVKDVDAITRARCGACGTSFSTASGPPQSGPQRPEAESSAQEIVGFKDEAVLIMLLGLFGAAGALLYLLSVAGYVR